PATGGFLHAQDGNAALAVPPGATGAPVAFTLTSAGPIPASVRGAAGARGPGSTLLRIAARDASGMSLAAFDAPLMVKVAPTARDLPVVGSAPTDLVLATADSSSGPWRVLPTLIDPDGRLQADITVPGLVMILQRARANSAAPDASDPQDLTSGR